MSLDEDTLKIYEEIKAAEKEGNLLMYANGLARRFAVSVRTEPRDPVIFQGREDAVTVSPSPSGRRQLGDRAVETIRPPTPQPVSMERQINRLNNSEVGRSIPAPIREQITREAMDSVRVSNL